MTGIAKRPSAMKTYKCILLALLTGFMGFPAMAEAPTSPEQLAQQVKIARVDFHDATVKESLAFVKAKVKELAAPQQLNINYIGKKPTDAKIDLSLTDIPVLELIKLIAHEADLGIRVTGNGIYLFPKDEQPDL